MICNSFFVIYIILIRFFSSLTLLKIKIKIQCQGWHAGYSTNRNILIYVRFVPGTILWALIGTKYNSTKIVINKKWKSILTWKSKFSSKKNIYLPPKLTFSHSNDIDIVFFFAHCGAKKRCAQIETFTLCRERENRKLQKIKLTFFLQVSEISTQSDRNDLKVRTSLKTTQTRP